MEKKYLGNIAVIDWYQTTLEFDFEKVNPDDLRNLHEWIVQNIGNLLFKNGLEFTWTHEIDRLLLHVPDSKKELVNSLVSKVKENTDSSRIEESLTHKREIYVWTRKKELVDLFRNVEIN